MFTRQRKTREDYKASLKINKNRHDLYADELVSPGEHRVTSWSSGSDLIYFNATKVLRVIYCYQERLTVGRKPEAAADMVTEGEVILTINVYYPAIYEKVSISFVFLKTFLQGIVKNI